MKSALIFLSFIAVLILAGCSNPMATSLLTNYSSSCDPLKNPGCADGESIGSTAISLKADRESLNPNAYIDNGDTIEISGSCVDQDRRKNRILVEVFAGDLNEAVDPYISNDIGSNCFNNVGAGATSSGILHGSRCFWITKGTGLIEDAGLPSQKDFPQCHNGQFGFSIRVGKVLTDTALGTNYLVRMKLRTEEGGIVQSAWDRVVINRQLKAPSIDSKIIDPALFQCTLKNSVARFNYNILYTLNRSFRLLNNTQSAQIALPGFTNITTANPLAFEYADTSLVDGVIYSYSITGLENEYAPYVPGPNPFAVSNTMQCQVANPFLRQLTAATSTKCSFYIDYANFSANVKYQIGSGPPSWTGTAFAGVNSPPVARACDPGTSFTAPPCAVSGLAPSSNYVFATRAYKDINGNNFPDVGEEIGFWSNESVCITTP